MVERQSHSPSLMGRGDPGVCSLSTGSMMVTGRSSRLRTRPPSGSRTTTGHPMPARGVIVEICGGHGPGETPGSIPNPEAKAWHGDGTALDRVWESSAPPHHVIGPRSSLRAPGVLPCPEHERTPKHTSHASTCTPTLVFFHDGIGFEFVHAILPVRISGGVRLDGGYRHLLRG